MRGHIVIALACLPALLPACGGASETERAKAVVAKWLKATAQGDHRTACGLMTSKAQRALGADQANPALRTCSAMIERNYREMPVEVRRLLIAGVEIERITLNGSRATIRPRELALFVLERIDGDWKIVRID
jgi:hypothetical protein